MEAQDWESATRHCARAMALPLDVTSGAFAESAVVSSAHVMDATDPHELSIAYPRKPPTPGTNIAAG